VNFLFFRLFCFFLSLNKLFLFYSINFSSSKLIKLSLLEFITYIIYLNGNKFGWNRQIKKDLNPDNFTNNRKDININEEIDKKNFDINNNENNNDNKKEEKAIIRNGKIEPQNKNEINNDINYGINI
jgi:hypothetical protein